MLKIIDDFDLKGLEEFGFEKYYNDDEFIGYKTPGLACIYVSNKTREFNINTMILGDLQGIVFDLIQKGIVEKI